MALPEVPKLNMSVAFASTSAIPTEYNSYFQSYEEAEAAAKTAGPPGSTETVYYYTQVLHVLSGQDECLYVILPNGTLSPILTGTSSGGDKTFVFTQNTAAAEWKIQHDLGKYPAVTVVDSGKTEVIGDVEYVDLNNLTLKFSSPFSGMAFLN